jgi:hypothetical protein
VQKNKQRFKVRRFFATECNFVKIFLCKVINKLDFPSAVAVASAFLGRVRWRGAILHNELMVLFLHHNFSLCNIAWGRFWAFEGWQQLFASRFSRDAMCCRSVGRSPKPQERWLSVGRAGANTSPAFFGGVPISFFLLSILSDGTG